MRKLIICLTLLSLFSGAGGAMEVKGIDGERVFIVNDYRYDPGNSGGDPDTGHALCGTRCNALSVDYRNFIEPGGWRFIKVASNREVALDLGNPFFDGKCLCIADEYVVRINDFNWQSRQLNKKTR
jgi:hypothetical protein